MNDIKITIINTGKQAEISNLEVNKTVKDVLSILSPGLTGKLIIEIMFVDKKKIQSLNKQYRRTDSPTDVLSFPQNNIVVSKENILGSIVVCPEIVAEKGEEISNVIKHGLLHLLGYDHETDEQEWNRVAKLINCDL